MTESTRSNIIQFENPNNLKAHAISIELYGIDDDKGLIDSVKELGVLQALYILPDKTIMSGHRRWQAAIKAGLTSIPCIQVVYTDELDERQAIVEFNRYRIKNGEQLYREGVLLEAVEADRAKERQAHGMTAPGQTLTETLPEAKKGETRDKVASAIGLGSGKQWDKLGKIGEEADSGNATAQKVLGQINKGKTLNAAYKDVFNKIKREQEIERIESTELPTGTYSVIVVDPPWQYVKRPLDSTHRGASPFESMAQEELLELSIPAADDAILWLWTTNAFLSDALALVHSWGFAQKTMLTWVKDKMGTGEWLRGKTEHAIMAVKGKYVVNLTNQTTALNAPSGQHSEKPDAFYNMVDELCPGTKIDMFARKARPGWDSWGAESDK